MPKKIVTNVLPFRTKKHILTAYDEAGHAVAAKQKGFPIRSVSILPSSISLGKLARTTLLSRIDVETPAMSEDIIRRNRGRIEDGIFITLAGPYAQRRFDPSSNWNDDSENSDLDEARMALALFDGCAGSPSQGRLAGVPHCPACSRNSPKRSSG